MRILLDENLPESLVGVLRGLGHQVDFVNSLRLKGLDNGTLYRQIEKDYDLCFTKDSRFAKSVNQMRTASSVKLLRVVITRRPAKLFMEDFVGAFQKTEWSKYENGSNWP